jgi:hypothetical protein
MVRGLIVEIGLQKRQITLPMKQNRASEEAGRRGEKRKKGIEGRKAPSSCSISDFMPLSLHTVRVSLS